MCRFPAYSGFERTGDRVEMFKKVATGTSVSPSSTSSLSNIKLGFWEVIRGATSIEDFT